MAVSRHFSLEVCLDPASRCTHLNSSSYQKRASSVVSQFVMPYPESISKSDLSCYSQVVDEKKVLEGLIQTLKRGNMGNGR